MREFPESVRETAGHQGAARERADDWKPMPTVGAGVQEIHGWDESGAHRVLYVAKFEEAVYVLHVVEKRPRRPEATFSLRRHAIRTC